MEALPLPQPRLRKRLRLHRRFARRPPLQLPRRHIERIAISRPRTFVSENPSSWLFGCHPREVITPGGNFGTANWPFPARLRTCSTLAPSSLFTYASILPSRARSNLSASHFASVPVTWYLISGRPSCP